MTSVATTRKMLNAKDETIPSREYEQLSVMLFSFIGCKQHIEAIGIILMIAVCASDLTCRCSSLLTASTENALQSQTNKKTVPWLILVDT